MTSPRPGWHTKFAVAISGITRSIRTDTSFWVHIPVGLAVVAVATWLQVEPWRWAAIVMVITIVFVAEMLNTALEQLTRVLHPQRDIRIGRVLDAAAGSVLVAAIGAVIVGLIALGMPLWEAVSR